MIKKIGNLEVEIEDSLENIIIFDTERVGRYLNSVNNYIRMGYKLRFPNVKDINRASYEEIKKAVVSEVTSNNKEYIKFRDDYFETLNKIISAGIQKNAKDLYGIELPSRVKIVPSLYGTISSPMSVENRTPFVIRLDKFVDISQPRSRFETLTHEIWAHGFTSNYRSGTELDDNLGAKTTKLYPRHKERLMDLFGRTLLVRTGLMQRNEVIMQQGMYEDIVDEVDQAYYIDKTNPNEYSVQDQGNLKKIVSNVILSIRN